MSEITAILGVIGSDCHAVGNKIIEHALSHDGIKVVNLGVMVSQDEFIEKASQELADARAQYEIARKAANELING